VTAELAGRHVVVTGGAGALGQAVVAAMIEAGAICHVPAVEADPPPSLRGYPAAQLRVVPRVDLVDEAAVVRFYGALPSLWASIHLAGGFAMAPITDTTLDGFQAQLALNTVTCFLSCREAVRAMRVAGGGGRIVNVAARPAVTPQGGMIAYTTAKAGVVSITQCLAHEVRGEGILVNAIAPSIIDTPANRRSMPDADHARWPAPAELAAAIRWLVSPDNALTWGAVVPVYGRA
jgi:NAD(P)-dependent dehydrogenase (short-subunit alcohol dehydrogenase family)